MLSNRECIAWEQEQIAQQIRDYIREREREMEERAKQFRTSRVTWERKHDARP